jgi:pyruvate/2-oxoacid:ferredoxin oxidoreductase beta subunit
VKTRIFPLYEVENGEKYTLNVDPPPIPVEEYLKLQGRFKHLNETAVKKIEEDVDKKWRELMAKFSNS